MKMILKDSKIVDKRNNLIPLYHATTHNDVKEFYSLSHFGTIVASNMRATAIIYDILKKPQPSVLFELPPNGLIQAFLQLKPIPPLCTYCVYLYARNPLRIPDLGRHTFDQYYSWFRNSYRPNPNFLSSKEYQESQKGRPQYTRYKQLLTDFIFIDPFRQPAEKLKKELARDSLCFSAPLDTDPFTTSYRPNFLKNVPVRSPFALAQKVGLQRMVRFLETEGYDAFIYNNRYEDRHHDSYIIFRPQQVFSCCLFLYSILPRFSFFLL